jgi:hypothetical protein
MGAPTPTARIKPAGTYLYDGFATKITFATNPSVRLWEISITPPGFDGGKPIDTTTMFNIALRTMALRQLKEMTEAKFEVAYHPGSLSDIIALINVATVVTLTFPNGKTWCFYGGLTKFEPGQLEEGALPKAACTFTPTTQDTAGAEQLPVYGT